MSRTPGLILSFFLLFLLLSAATAMSQHGSSVGAEGPRTLTDYRQLAYHHNIGIQASTSRAQAARQRVGVEQGYPDPALMYGYYAAPDPMRGRQEIILQQPIPFPGKRGLRGDVARGMADRSADMTDALALDVDFDVRVAFFEYVRASEVARVLAEERDLIVRMRDVAQVRYASGTAEQQEVLKLELSLSQIDDELGMNEHDQDRVRVRLNELIGRVAEAPLPPPQWTQPDAVLTDATALADSALVARPEMAAARAEMRMTEAAHRLARREYVPDLMLGVMYEFGAGVDPHWEILTGVNLPIWLGQRRARVREAEANRTASAYQLDAEVLRVRRDVEDALHGVYNARDRLVRFDTRILPQAEQSFRSAEAGYRAGRVDFLDYLDSERMFLAMRKEYFGVIAELGIHVASLDRALGIGIATE